MATSGEGVPYDRRCIVRVGLTLFKGGLDLDLVLIFEDSSFDGMCAWVAVSGSEGGSESTCFSLDRHY